MTDFRKASQLRWKFVDINYIYSITLNDMYAFISYYQNERNASAGAQSRRIVLTRQFWKYLKDNDLIESNIAERLETFKQPKRLPRYLSLEESVRLLIACSENPRDHCIIWLSNQLMSSKGSSSDTRINGSVKEL